MVGIVKGYEEAVELVEQIVQEVYEQTGGCDIRSYILEKSREDKMVLHILLIILKNNRDHNCGASRTDTVSVSGFLLCVPVRYRLDASMPER